MEAAAALREPVLEARSLAFAYGERSVLSGVSLRLARGELVGLLGPNGAGKSTLLGMLTGTLVGQGELYLSGRPISASSREYRARLGVVFQVPALDLELSARENLLLGARLYAVPRALARQRAASALRRFGLEERASDRVKTYSGGMRRKLELARVLLHEPDLVIMDEPTQGLDVATRRALWEHVDALRHERGMAVLMSTHDPAEAERCDRLLVLDHGQVIAEGTPAALCAQVGGDVITLSLADSVPAHDLAGTIKSQLGLVARVMEGQLVLCAPRGHELVPRLVELCGAARLRAVQLRPPTLQDAFLTWTGRRLAEEAA